ncbi:MAG TPA: hypothetical protein VMW48_00615 [Vicinamibacterales bacterium]|nr:hypothetical protein [Vicinamibacterales bacterium]
MPKRPNADDSAPITDEWGIYDPAKAGMQALYAKLGRPVLRASEKSTRQARRRGFRPERPNDGVGLAIQEAMIRAGMMDAKGEPIGTPVVPESSARAVRIALKSAKPAVAKAPFIPVNVAPSAAGKKKATTRRAKSAATETAPPTTAQAERPARVKPRAARKTASSRTKAERAAIAATPAAPAPPAPSPRRPRGPVPLAAWAHAVIDTPKSEPRRADKRGFWKGIFRMPAEVALVEYARGCRIHRLHIETSDDVPMLDLL